MEGHGGVLRHGEGKMRGSSELVTGILHGSDGGCTGCIMSDPSSHPAMLLDEIRTLLQENRQLRIELDTLRADLAARTTAPELLPESYELPVAQKLLGGISRSTIYRDVHRGLLDRVPHTRRVLITRESIERRKKIAA